MTTTPPRVSVIVPNYNYARYLTERIESILTQTYQDFELILLEDCSSDESRSILERYAQHPKVSHYVANEQNSGSPFVQWERGLLLARGEYIWIAEADDSCTPELLERLVAALEAHPAAIVAYAGSQLIDQSGQPLRTDYDTWQEDGTLHHWSSGEYLRTRLAWHATIYNASMAVFRRSTHSHISKDYTSLRSCGDWLFWLEVTRQGDVLELRTKLNRFRQHTERVTVRTDRTLERLAELGSVIRYLGQRQELSPWKKRVRRGQLYKETRRLYAGSELAEAALAYLRTELGIGRLDYLCERLDKGLRELTKH